jgi:hypothetical protein
MRIVGYLEGTDPAVLTKLYMKGIGTLPLGNGWDNHGKYVNHLTPADDVDAVIGYLHKIVPPAFEGRLNIDTLFACTTHGIPVYLMVPGELHGKARDWLGEDAAKVNLVDPDEVYDTLIEKLC